MPKFDTPSDVFEVLSAPMGDLISSVGRSVAEAQQAIDHQSIENFKAIYEEGEEALSELAQLGYRPNWYHFPEVNAEITVALTVSGTSESQSSSTSGALQSSSYRIFGAPIDATYKGRFDYDLRASSRVKFKIIPIPPPGAAEEMQIAPSVVGKSVAEARVILEDLQITFAFEASTTTVTDASEISEQLPSAGGILLPGVPLVLVLDGT